MRKMSQAVNNKPGVPRKNRGSRDPGHAPGRPECPECQRELIVSLVCLEKQRLPGSKAPPGKPECSKCQRGYRNVSSPWRKERLQSVRGAPWQARVPKMSERLPERLVSLEKREAAELQRSPLAGQSAQSVREVAGTSRLPREKRGCRAPERLPGRPECPKCQRGYRNVSSR